MSNLNNERGGVLVATLWVGILLTVIGGVAMDFARTEKEVTRRQVKETSARLLAESGVEQVVAWLNHGGLPQRAQGSLVFNGTEASPDMTYDSGRVEEDRFLNDASSGIFQSLTGLGRIERIVVYGPSHPDGICTVDATAETKAGVRRTVSLELGGTLVPPLGAAIQFGARSASVTDKPRVLAHWGPIRIAGDVALGRTADFPRKLAGAPVTGLSYGETGGTAEDRWVEAWIGGTAQFEDPESGLPSNVHSHQDPAPGLQPAPWQYQKFKDLAMRFGRYYVPDATGRLYLGGNMDPASAKTPTEVFQESVSNPGLVFVDTLDHTPPSADNMVTLTIDVPYMEGVFFVNAHVTLNPSGTGNTISALSPPSDGTDKPLSRVPVRIGDVTVRGVLHTTGSLRVEGQTRIFGSVVAERGVIGGGLLEVWFDYDLGRSLVRGLPVVFPLSGTWREWGS